MTAPSPAISVIIPTHNPNASRLDRTLAALQAQGLTEPWELVVIDNASSPALTSASLRLDRFPTARVIRESEVGLTAARRRGLRETVAPVCVFVDDDNVLAPTYLAASVGIFTREPRLGAAGGKSLPEFETPPPAWAREFFPLLAVRDLGDTPQLAHGLQSPGAAHNRYPDCAPIGAGMAVRRTAIAPWLESTGDAQLSDRRGTALTSSGDNDIVLSILRAGWSVGYFPELHLTHLIPAERLNAVYLARLNRGVQESWMRVLSKHDANPWPPLSPFGAALRRTKAWFAHQAWRGEAHRIRWQGACGHFSGRVSS